MTDKTKSRPWGIRYHGSAPEKGYTVICADRLHNNEPIAYLGDGDLAQAAAEALVEAHNREVASGPCVIEYRTGDVVVRHEAPTVELLDALLKLDKARQPERVTVTLDTKIVGPSIEQMAQDYWRQHMPTTVAQAGNPDGIPGA